MALTIDPWVETPFGVSRLEDLLPTAVPLPEKPSTGAAQPFSAPVTHAGRADGALSGKAIYLSQCHGYIWFNSLGRFSTQRGNLFDTVEDLHNPEGMNQFLTVYLENAGANVFTVKERDHTRSMVIVDNDDASSSQYQETGAGFASVARGWGRKATLKYGEDPFRLGTSRRMPATGGGVARFTVDPPQTGRQAVYVSWVSGSDHATQARYRFTHPGGTFERTFDQRVHGSTWQYIDTLWLNEGEPLIVELIGDTGEAGRFVSIDAVRVGGGSGVVERHGVTTGRPRWEEGANISAQFNGAPTGVYDAFGDRVDGNDVVTRSRWAAWESPSGEDALYLSWHSNASADGSARGTVTYIYEGSQGAPVAGSYNLAAAVQEELVDAFQMFWEPGWRDRGVRSAAFGEVNPAHNPKMPSALIELAFHDNATDANFLKHPKFRRDAARAMYRGVVRYYAQRDGVTPVYLPEPPVGLELRHDSSGRLALSWKPGPVGAPYGNAPTGYLVQTSRDGLSWDEGISVSGTSTVLDTRIGRVVYARVIATNAGGMSFASEVMAGRRSPDGSTPVLLVDAFDRFDSGQLDWENLPAVGNVRRFLSHRVNPYDIVAPHARAIAEAGWFFDSISDEQLPHVDLSKYRLIVWGTGEESTADETFSTAQQRILRPWWSAGGAIWTSGSEILWDLDHRGDAEDKAFALEVLGATLKADSAETSIANGVGLLDGINLSFPAATAPYPVEWPDELNSSRPVVARYATGTIAGVLGERVALFGFPFEAIADPASRAEVAKRLLPALVPGYTPPEVPDDPEESEPEDPSDTPDVDRPLRSRIGEPRACGCSSGTTSAIAMFWLPALLLLRRRARR
jgi:hypothetical protein